MVGGVPQGLCEGTVDEDPQEGSWWQAVVAKVHSQGGAPQGRAGNFRQRTEVPIDVGVRVGLDFGAGAQSARQLVEGCGVLYTPLDIKRWVSSARLGEWVENLALDFSKGTRGLIGVWSRIRAAVLQQWGVTLGAQLVTIGILWMSPLCRTFSNADASNRDKGCRYRDHRVHERHLLQGGSSIYGQ